jgi:hypothetical protein
MLKLILMFEMITWPWVLEASDLAISADDEVEIVRGCRLEVTAW